jgi:hypothetical protein
VTSVTVPYIAFGQTLWYEVKINVTNTGRRVYEVVYVFIFPYRNNTLLDWNFISYSREIRGLWPGETQTARFTLPSDVTTFRLVVVGAPASLS